LPTATLSPYTTLFRSYFQYDMPSPQGNSPVAIYSELSPSPWNSKHHLLRVSLKAKDIPTENLPSSNFVFLIDVSGSMYDANKLRSEEHTSELQSRENL